MTSLRTESETLVLISFQCMLSRVYPGPRSASFIHVAPCAVTTPRSITYDKAFAVATLFFAYNIATAPLKAYLNEPFPWALPPPSNHTRLDLAAILPLEYTNISTAYYYDSATFTDVLMRRPSALSESCVTHLTRLAGAPFYGDGLRAAVCAYIDANASTPFAFCQEIYLFRKLVGHGCVWTQRDANQTSYFYAIRAIFDANLVWFKLFYRLVLTMYASAQLWRCYYRHYASLLRTLRNRNTLQKVVRYHVFVGDPTGVVLSDPVLVLAFLIDIFLSSYQLVASILHLGQIDDMLQFALGVFYLSRLVWAVFFGMRYGTYLIKLLRWERHFTSLDTTVMTVLTLVMTATISLIVAHSPLMAMYHWMNALGLEEETAPVAIETAASAIALAVCTAATPLQLALALAFCRRYHDKRGLSARQLQHNVKQRVLFTCRRDSVVEHEGSSLYRLFKNNPRYRRLPLVGLEGADCFVDAYDSTGTVVLRLRLSLMDVALDQRVDGDAPRLDHHSGEEDFCTLSNAPTGKPSASPSAWLL